MNDNRIRFKLAFKNRVLKFYESCKSFRKTAKNFNIDRKTVKYWVKSKDDIMNNKFKRLRTQCRSISILWN